MLMEFCDRCMMLSLGSNQRFQQYILLTKVQQCEAYIIFVVSLRRLLNKQSYYRWSETIPVWRHCNTLHSIIPPTYKSPGNHRRFHCGWTIMHALRYCKYHITHTAGYCRWEHMTRVEAIRRRVRKLTDLYRIRTIHSLAHCKSECCCIDLIHIPWSQGSWGPHGAHLGPTGPRWAPCWPHDPCYLGYHCHCRCY